MNKKQFVNILYESSINKSRNIKTSPLGDNLDKKLSGIYFGIDKYGNTEVRTQWYKDDKPLQKTFSMDIPESELLDAMKFAIENNVVSQEKEKKSLMSGKDDTPVDDVKTTTEAVAKNNSDIVSEDSVCKVDDLELPKDIAPTREKLTMEQIKIQREERAILDSVGETPEGWEVI